MQVTEIIQSSKNKYMCSVCLADNKILTLHIYYVKKQKISVGSDVDYEKVLNDAVIPKIKKKAFDFLSKRMYGENELLQKLMDYGFLKDEILGVIDYCRENDLLNDEQFARAFIKDGINLKKWSLRRIRQELARKRVSENIVSDLLHEFEDADTDNIKKYVQRYLKDKSDYKQVEKIRASLYRKGYNLGLINKILGEAEDFE